jgi:hypothetical protein
MRLIIPILILIHISSCSFHDNTFEIDYKSKAIRGKEGTIKNVIITGKDGALHFVKKNGGSDVFYLLNKNSDCEIFIDGMPATINVREYIFQPKNNEEYQILNCSNGDAISYSVTIKFDSNYNIILVQ